MGVPIEGGFDVWLRSRLKARRMSQRQLAHLSGVDHSTISRLLAGDRTPSLGTATKLARALREIRDEPGAAPALAVLASPGGHPTARVEYALRADEKLGPTQVRQLMDHYLRLRQEPGPPERVRPVFRAVHAAAPPSGS